MLVGDGGGKALAISRPLVGATGVAKALLSFMGRGEALGIVLEPVRVNGQPGMRALAPDGRLVNVLAIDVAGGRVVRLHSLLNPDKLGHLGPISDLGLRRRPGGA